MPRPAANAKLKSRILAAIVSGGALAGLGASLDHFEGSDRTTAFADMGGTATICRGITEGVQLGQTATREQCLTLDAAAARAFLASVDAGFVRLQPDARRVAFADFAYNVGKAAFLNSTARRLVNAGRVREGCEQLDRWVYVRGRVIPWQVQRRALERDLCLEGLSP